MGCWVLRGGVWVWGVGGGVVCYTLCVLYVVFVGSRGGGMDGWMDGESGEEEIKARRRRRKAKLGKGIN